MREILSVLLAVVLTASCHSGNKGGLTGFAVTENGDFVWENDAVCYSVKGSADKAAVSPGIDMFCKNGGTMVTRSRKAMRGVNSICRGLGIGGSAVMADTGLVFPPENYSSVDILRHTPDELTFVLHYNGWKLDRQREVRLDKQITVKAGSSLCKVVDYYNGYFDDITIAAGVELADTGGAPFGGKDFVAANVNGQKVAVLSSDSCTVYTEPVSNHVLISRSVYPDEPFTYYICTTFGTEIMSEWEKYRF